MFAKSTETARSSHDVVSKRASRLRVCDPVNVGLQHNSLRRYLAGVGCALLPPRAGVWVCFTSSFSVCLLRP